VTDRAVTGTAGDGQRIVARFDFIADIVQNSDNSAIVNPNGLSGLFQDGDDG
jgi:hypothetical protein